MKRARAPPAKFVEEPESEEEEEEEEEEAGEEEHSDDDAAAAAAKAESGTDDGMEDGGDGDDDEEAELERAALMASKHVQPLINDKAGLLRRLREIEAPQRSWIEAAAVTGDAKAADEVPDVDDDLHREVVFYQHALASAMKARQLYREADVPFDRPDDYFAEMIKSDMQMQKVKDKLLFEQKKMKAFELRKQQQEQRKFAKQVQAKKQEERVQQKKAQLDAIEKWKKTKKSAASGGLEEALEAAVPTGKKRKAESQEVGGRAGDAKRPSQRPNKRREMKDKKYGYGGNKRGAKRNDKASTDDMRSFSVHQNSARTFGKRGGKSNAGANRPGKATRQKMRTASKRA